ncbi:MAG: hypothetical protein LRY31_05550 [Burkholderiaceae bacterium]|nr:hypothetical protein [Burkholderiaceae bacterium]
METLSPIDHHAPIEERINWLFNRIDRHGASFRSPEAWLARQRYMAQHPTAVAALKCMDGRINLSVATQTPAGILMPFRNLGGMFNLGWPHLGEILTHYVQGMVQTGRRVLLLITYHWSKGDVKRGCAGFHYNRQASMEHAWGIRDQVSHLFGHAHQTVYPLVCGFETDQESLLLHSPGGATLDIADLTPADSQELAPRLAALLPDMPAPVLADLLPLLKGNLAHVEHIRALSAQHERQLAIDHREWIICLGRGFDFLHTPNMALIVGPYSPDLAHPIRTATSIIESNMRRGRIPDDGFLLLASVPYEAMGVERARAELKARFMERFAADVIREAYPELAQRMHSRVAVLDWEARRMELIGPG